MPSIHIPAAGSLRAGPSIESNCEPQRGPSALDSPIILLAMTLLGVLAVTGLAIGLALSSI